MEDTAIRKNKFQWVDRKKKKKKELTTTKKLESNKETQTFAQKRQEDIWNVYNTK